MIDITRLTKTELNKEDHIYFRFLCIKMYSTILNFLCMKMCIFQNFDVQNKFILEFNDLFII